MNTTTKANMIANLKAQYNMALTDGARQCAHSYVVTVLSMRKEEREEIENFFD